MFYLLKGVIISPMLSNSDNPGLCPDYGRVWASNQNDFLLGCTYVCEREREREAEKHCG